MNFGISDFFVKDKSCLVDDPWEAKGETDDEKRRNWSRCAGERATAGFIATTIALLIVLIIICIVAYFSMGGFYAGALFVVGGIILVGASYAGNIVYGKKTAELVMDNYLHELDAEINRNKVLINGDAAKKEQVVNAFVDRKRQEKAQNKHLAAMTSRNYGVNPMGMNPMGFNPMGFNPMGTGLVKLF